MVFNVIIDITKSSLAQQMHAADTTALVFVALIKALMQPCIVPSVGAFIRLMIATAFPFSCIIFSEYLSFHMLNVKLLTDLLPLD